MSIAVRLKNPTAQKPRWNDGFRWRQAFRSDGTGKVDRKVKVPDTAFYIFKQLFYEKN